MINEIFKYKSLNKNKLIPFGFTEQNGIYKYETEIFDCQFKMIVEIGADETVKTQVLDISTQEPYTLHLVETACGAFVGGVRSEYEKFLTEIADNCFEKDVFKSKQAHELINYIFNKYGDELEFLWEKFSSNAIWRRKDNNKWYGALLVVSKRKLGLASDEVIDILDLRAEPEDIESIVDGKSIFAGYHMNKKHWITIPLDYSLPSKELFKFVDKSYTLAKK